MDLKPILRKTLIPFIFLFVMLSVNAETIGLFYDFNNSQHVFAAQEIGLALQANGHTVELLNLNTLSPNYSNKKIVIANRSSAATQDVLVGEGGVSVGTMNSEAYSMQTTSGGGKSYYILGGQDSGTLYGALALSNAIKSEGLTGNHNKTQSPFMNTRGIKFNIPLDARTPSYSDDGTAAWENVVHMWEIDFWKEFIDELARNYYNTITLWTLNPFPSMVKTPDFPNADLDDVYKANTVWEAGQSARNMVNNQVLNNLVKVKTISIDQKIQHWKDVMAYAKTRGVKIYIMTWNIYPFGLENSGYNITRDINNQTTRNYYRNSVKAMFDTYPDLAGMGVTAGENFVNTNSAAAAEWLWDTYGRAIKQVKEENPNRKIKFIHRLHYTRLNEIMDNWSNFPGFNTPGDFDFSFKYAVAHMHSSTKPGYIGNFLNQIPNGKKTWVTIRNDDHYYMRWGDPDYIRDYVNNFPPEQKFEGAYVGPDGYTWGREYVSKAPQSTERQLVIKKFWYAMEIFGRLCYDPNTPNSYFKNAIGNKFPTISKEDLFNAWQSTSKITPLLNRFHWGPSDHMWYPEMCMSDKGFKSVRHFLDPQFDPMGPWEDGQRPNLMPIQEFVAGSNNGEITPLEVADRLDVHAQTGLNTLGNMNGGANQELKETINDIKAMASLGKYYADKIRGCVSLHTYEENGGQNNKDTAITSLQSAAAHWNEYATIMTSMYKGQILTRQGTDFHDFMALQANVDADIVIAQNAVDGGSGGDNIIVSFASPANNSNHPIGTNLDVTVNGAAIGGSVSNVKLYLNNTLVRQENNAPYNWNGANANDAALGNMVEGVYILKAVVTDNSNATNETSITVTVGDAGSDNMSLSFANPTNNSIHPVGVNLPVTVNATVGTGGISNVKLYLDDVLVRQENNSPYNWSGAVNDTALGSMAEGVYELKAVATDNIGWTKEESITIIVDASLSTASYDSEDNTSIYPNPLNGDLLNIEFGDFESNDNKVQVSLYSITGQLVLHKELQFKQKLDFEINPEIKNSIYFVKITYLNSEWIRKIVLQR